MGRIPAGCCEGRPVALAGGRGGFDGGSSLAVAQGLLWYGLAFLPAGGVYFFNYSHYAMQGTGPLVQAGLLTLGGTFVLDVVFVRWWGFSGVAVATSSSAHSCAGISRAGCGKERCCPHT